MKRSLFLIIVGFFVAFFDVAFTYAQNTADTVLPRILYTNSERTAILGKTLGWNKVDTVLKSAVGAGGRYVTLKNLTVLASTKDGKSLLISCRAVFFNPIFNGDDSLWVIARVDTPFVNTGVFNPVTYTFGNVKVLKYFTIDNLNNFFHFTGDKMMPIGVLTPQEDRWFVSLNKNSGGVYNQWFFHGKFDGTGTIDSFYIDPTNTNTATNAAQEGYHMTNLVTSDDGNSMYTVIMDEIFSDKPRCQVMTWNPSVAAGNFSYSFGDISGAIRGAVQPVGIRPDWEIDSAFTFILRSVPNNNPPKLQFGLVYDAKGDIQLFDIHASGSISSIDGSAGNHIFRTNLPKGSDGKQLQFFTGYTGQPGNADDGKEVIAPGKGFPLGNGGDMQFSPDGNSLVFVTSRSDAVATTTESGIYILDMSSGSSGKIDSVINDPNEMERQPIFTKSVVHPYVAPPKPKYIPGIAMTDSSSLTFGVDSIIAPPGSTQPLQVTFKFLDTSASGVILKSAVLNSNNAGAFTLVSPSLPPNINVAARGSQIFTIRFTPTAEQTYTCVLEIHYADSMTSEKDSILKIPISGVGVKAKVQNGGVASSAPLSFDLSIVPNPFTSSTQITISARESGKSSLEIRDLLGKEVYATHTLSLSQGEKYNYTLDANALQLAPGTYFVIVRSEGQELTRQAIYVK